MNLKENGPQLRYLLEVHCVVTAGSLAPSNREKRDEKTKDLPLRRKQSEMTRLGFNGLLRYRHIRSKCSFGMHVNDQEFNYQQFSHGAHDVELLAQVTGLRDVVDTGEQGVDLEVILSSTFEGIGGLRKYGGAPALPMIPGNWYLLGGCGNSRIYLEQVARLTNVDVVPTEAEIYYRTNERASKAFASKAMRTDLLE